MTITQTTTTIAYNIDPQDNRVCISRQHDFVDNGVPQPAVFETIKILQNDYTLLDIHFPTLSVADTLATLAGWNVRP